MEIVVINRFLTRSPFTRLWLTRVILGGCFVLAAANFAPPAHAQRSSGASSTQAKLAALKQAHDSGVLTDDEYKQKVAALSGGSRGDAATATQGARGAGADGHSWKLRRVEQSAPLTDWRTNQTRTVKMMSMLLPEGWTMQPQPGPNFGRIDCNNNSSRFVLKAQSADGSVGILVLPAAAKMWSTNQAVLQQKRAFNQQWKMSQCILEQPKSLSAGLHEDAPKMMAGTQIVGDIQPVPDLSAQLPQIVAGSNQHLAGNGHMTAEAGRLRVTYSANGRSYEAWVVAMKTERTSPAPGGGEVIISDYPLLAIEFAPAGQLDRNDKLLDTVLASVAVDPDWTQQGEGYVAAVFSKINGAEQEVARIHANMAQDNARAAQQQQQIRNGVQQYRSQVMSNVAANRSAALDHSSQQFALYMGDQAIYKDPSSGQRVQMSSGYDHVWASTTGNNSEYILTDSASYNPNGQAGSAGWTQMQVEH